MSERRYPIPLTKEQQLKRIQQERITAKMRADRRRHLDENKVEELAIPSPEDVGERSDYPLYGRIVEDDKVDVLVRALAIVLRDDCNSTKLRDWLEIAIAWDLCPTWQEL
jgi:hypothetical protein